MPEPSDLKRGEFKCVMRELANWLSTKVKVGDSVSFNEALGSGGLLNRPQILERAGLERKRLSEVQWTELWEALGLQAPSSVSFVCVGGNGADTIWRREAASALPIDTGVKTGSVMNDPEISSEVSLGDDFSISPKRDSEVLAEGSIDLVVWNDRARLEYHGPMLVKITF